MADKRQHTPFGFDILWHDNDDGTYAQAVYDLNAGGAPSFATKIQVVGALTYTARAIPGSSQSDSVWQVFRIDESTPGTSLITWADGDANFSHVAADLPSLSYR